MTTWNYVDLILIGLVLLSMLRGWQRGFWLGLIDLLVWIGSLWAALRFYQPVARWIGTRIGLPEQWDAPLAFLLTMGIASALLNTVGYALVRRLAKREQRASGARLAGIVPGAINGFISAAIAAALLLALPLPANFRAAARGSSLANRLAAYTEQLQTTLTPVFGDAIAQTLNTITIRPESDETVPLPFTVSDAPPRPDLEAEMLKLINSERAEVGLPPLAADPELTAVARAHSADMLARGYFAHTSPEGRSPFDRMDAAGIRYTTAGENLALAPTLTLVHTGLMNSPGHRANILRAEFGRVGLGIVDGGVRGIMVTQNFRN